MFPALALRQRETCVFLTKGLRSIRGHFDKHILINEPTNATLQLLIILRNNFDVPLLYHVRLHGSSQINM